MTRIFNYVLLLVTGIFAALAALGLAGAGAASLGGAVPLGEEVLVATSGMVPNYASYAGNVQCCINYVKQQPNSTCTCRAGLTGNWGASCAQCMGICAPSGLYSTNYTSGIQPTGDNADCSHLILWTGTCDFYGNCESAESPNDCSGSYPVFDYEPIGIREGAPPSWVNRIAMVTGVR